MPKKFPESPTGMRWCSSCKDHLPLENFHKLSSYRSGHGRYCAGCANKRRRDWYEQTDRSSKEKWRHIKSKFGLDKHVYIDMLKQQAHKCKICGADEADSTWETLVVDHCHVTGKLRGLICNHCNVGLGRFKDSPELLERALLYLREYELS